VPHVVASSWSNAFFQAGYAVAEDRLWQMDLSRRVARGKMAELLGSDYIASDREVLQGAYTDQELQEQFDLLSPKARESITAYTRGVNAYIADATRLAKLPASYAKISAAPVNWSELDSVAISIRLWRMFGRGGAGELRDMAALEYLKNQKCKDKVLDVLDDFAWPNDVNSPTTVQDEDDPLAGNPPRFPSFSRSTTEKHIALLPRLNPFELLPAIESASNEVSTRVAQSMNVPYKTGSYAIVVSKQRSITGVPLLLSGPQMGFTNPSIAHEMSMSAPGISVSGMDVPGIPGVLIGYTPRFAWGLTSGVADIEDIFFFKSSGTDDYLYGKDTKKLKHLPFTLRVKGDEPVTVNQLRTMFGPVVFMTKSGGGYYFSRRASYWMTEMKSYDALIQLYGSQNIKDIEKSLSQATMSFNAFYATTDGEIGYRYIGAVPIRAEGLDPRFPTFASPENDWKGLVPYEKMPHVSNPKGGLLTNWNNKAVKWWPNGDTPVWGAINRVTVLRDCLQAPKLSRNSLEMAAWTIARREEMADALLPRIRKNLNTQDLGVTEKDAARYLLDFDGLFMEGSQGASIFNEFRSALQEELFKPSVGTFLSPRIFNFVIQPSLLILALDEKTAYNYLGNRTQAEVIQTAFKKSVARLAQRAGDDPSRWFYSCNKILSFGKPGVPYSNRGTYIQIIELRQSPTGMNVLPPGVAEDGPHATDQIPLSAAWLYKPMTLPVK
jgi:penicillin amidase